MATAFTVIVLFAGAAIDFGRGVDTHGSMQDAADSTALATASMDGNASQSDQIAMAEKVFSNNYSQTFTDSATTVVSFDGENITVEAKADVGTTFMAAAKVDKIPVSVSSTAWRGRRDPICVLALDPSGAAAFNLARSTCSMQPQVKCSRPSTTQRRLSLINLVSPIHVRYDVPFLAAARATTGKLLDTFNGPHQPRTGLGSPLPSTGK